MSHSSPPEFRPSTIIVLRGDHGAMGDSTGGMYCHGSHVLFAIQIDGPGSFDWFYDAAAESVRVESVYGTTEETSILIESVHDSPLRLESITLSDPVGSLTVRCPVGTVNLKTRCDGRIDIVGSVDCIRAAGSWHGNVVVDGGLGCFEVDGDVQGAGSILIRGDAGALDFGGLLAKSVEVAGSLESLSALRIAGGVQVVVAGDVGGVASLRSIGESEHPVGLSIGGKLMGFTAGGAAFVDIDVRGHIVALTTMGNAPVIGSIAAGSMGFLTVGGYFDADLRVRGSIDLIAIAGRLIRDRVFEVVGDVGHLTAGTTESDLPVSGVVGSGTVSDASVERSLLDRAQTQCENEEHTPSDIVVAVETEQHTNGVTTVEHEEHEEHEEHGEAPGVDELLAPTTVAFDDVMSEVELDVSFGEFTDVSLAALDSDEISAQLETDLGLDSSESPSVEPCDPFESYDEQEASTDRPSAVDVGAHVDGDASSASEANTVDDRDTAGESTSSEDYEELTPELAAEMLQVLEADETFSIDEDVLVAALEESVAFEESRKLPVVDATVVGVPSQVPPTSWRDAIQRAREEGKSFAEVFVETARYAYSAEDGELTPVAGSKAMPTIKLDETDAKSAWLWGLLRSVAKKRAE